MLNSINLMSWNIQGLTDNVVDDDYFVSCIESNDIIVLVETWLSDQVQIIPEKYYNYHNLRPMHARARRPLEVFLFSSNMNSANVTPKWVYLW